ncbi:MAG TPA: hypothetical protein VFJ18_11560 [Pararhizobium sp.]|nr:hypothetical protein [Pararhizobium sp.]
MDYRPDTRTIGWSCVFAGVHINPRDRKEIAVIKQLMLSAALAAMALPALPAFAQDAATVKVSQSDQYGKYLTDANGRSLYLFTKDTQGQGGAKATVSCSGDCLQAWPPFYTDGKPQAGDQADASMLGTIQHDSKMMVTYNGWPLYYFVKDQSPGDTNGQDKHGFGGEWYLVSPQGDKVEKK